MVNSLQLDRIEYMVVDLNGAKDVSDFLEEHGEKIQACRVGGPVSVWRLMWVLERTWPCGNILLLGFNRSPVRQVRTDGKWRPRAGVDTR